MSGTPDVVVIGGGIHGCSTALHLALRGAEADPDREGLCRPPRLGRQCRRRAPARAPSRRDPAADRLDGIWEHIGDLVDDDCGFERHGQVLVAENEAELASFASARRWFAAWASPTRS